MINCIVLFLQVVEYSADKKEAEKIVNSHKSKVEPLEKVVDKAKSGISKLEQQKLAAVSDFFFHSVLFYLI